MINQFFDMQFIKDIFSPWLWMLLFLVFFAFYTLLSWTGLCIFFPSKINLEKRLEKYSRQKKRKKEDNSDSSILKNSFLQKGRRFTAKVTANRKIAEELEELLQKAALKVKSSEFIFFHILAVLAFSLIGLILGNGKFFLALIFVLIGAFGPLLFLYFRIYQRSKKFHQQLPDTLDLIAGSLKAGYSFLQSLKMVVEETSPPIKEEFQKVILEARLGLPLEKALDNLIKRIDSESLIWTMMAVKIQKEVGGNLAEVLETLAATIRDRERISRQIKVLTAEGRLSAIILFLLPFVLTGILALINPGYLVNLFDNQLGLIIVGISIFLMFIGGLWLKKIVSIEV